MSPILLLLVLNIPHAASGGNEGRGNSYSGLFLYIGAEEGFCFNVDGKYSKNTAATPEAPPSPQPALEPLIA
jgi:hypothetical protein